ncbi:hypothetical protein CL655_03065 [bacterium]|nr:hypothetical protein [bacterium]|tara:strand:+ start:1529 stop:1942 length:414 start_codon:yes stop_codon:yes gene_type:complete
MHWFLDPIKNQYADFSGRTSRQAFWMYVLWYVIIYVVVALVASAVGVEALVMLLALAIFIPSLAITARRLHDTGLSGWWQLIGLVPVLGLIVMIILTVRPGEAGANQYGPATGGAMPEAAPEPAAETASADDTQQMV